MPRKKFTSLQQARRDKQVDAIVTLGQYGFSAKVIGRKAGCDAEQVYSVLYRKGMRLKDYRDGRNVIAKRVISKLVKARLYKVG